MTTTARDLVEAGAKAFCVSQGVDPAETAKLDWRRDVGTIHVSRAQVIVPDQIAALIATFRKLAEDGPTEALQLVLDDMTDEACAGWRVVCRALLRELEDLTP